MRIYAGPSRYVQGCGAFFKIGEEIKGLNLQGKAFIVISKTAEAVTRPLWEKSLKENEIEFVVYSFGGECSEKEIQKITEQAKSDKIGYFVAIGGGKALDAGKAAAENLEKEVIICPSIASTDAPCIALSVIYTEKGEMEKLRFYRKNPILVLVDSAVIAKAPRRFLVSGMGDALSTYYEARTCKNKGALNPRGGLITEIGIGIAKLCRDIILADGIDVIAAYETQGVTPAFKRIVEANILLSGMAVELCNVASAHAIHNGLAQLEETHAYHHGEKVAFGLITQLVLEGEDPQEIHRLLRFYKEVGLPSTFSQIGLKNPTKEMLLKVAKRSMIEGESMYYESFTPTTDMIIDAMRYADSLGKAYV